MGLQEDMCKKDDVQTTHGRDASFVAQRMPPSVAQHLSPLFCDVFHHHLTDNIQSIKENNNIYSIRILSLKHDSPIDVYMGMQETSSQMRRSRTHVWSIVWGQWIGVIETSHPLISESCEGVQQEYLEACRGGF